VDRAGSLSQSNMCLGRATGKECDGRRRQRSPPACLGHTCALGISRLALVSFGVPCMPEREGGVQLFATDMTVAGPGPEATDAFHAVEKAPCAARACLRSLAPPTPCSGPCSYKWLRADRTRRARQAASPKSDAARPLQPASVATWKLVNIADSCPPVRRGARPWAIIGRGSLQPRPRRPARCCDGQAKYNDFGLRLARLRAPLRAAWARKTAELEARSLASRR
jgi:hypothetical protein